jgi:hypothetical protein
VCFAYDQEESSSQDTHSVPFWGAFEVDFDRLFWIADVKPAPIALPPLGDHLDEHAPQRRVRNMGNAFAICLHIQFHGLVFLDLMLFNVFEIDAGVFNRCFFFAPGDLDGDARLRIGSRSTSLWFGRRRGILRRCPAHNDERCHKARTQNENSGEVHHFAEHHPLRKGGPRSSLCRHAIGCLDSRNCCSRHSSLSDCAGPA